MLRSADRRGPRVVGSQVMMRADLKRLHKYMLEIEHISLISDEMRAVLEEDGQSWRTSCRRRRSVKDDGETVFRHACKIGLEDIMSKRKDSAYRSGRSPDWLKMQNPACSAVKREAEEDWGR